MTMKKLHKSLFFYLTLLAFLPIGFSIPARGEIITERDRFELWNDCKPIDLIVETLNSNATKIGLKKETITTMVRSRLRAARLYNKKSGPYFYVQITVSGSGSSINTSLSKILLDAASNLKGLARTWYSGSTGTHGQDASYVMSNISEHTDEFIDEYLRVNESACK